MKETLVFMLLLMGVMFGVSFACRMWSVKFSAVKLSHYENFEISPEPKYVTKTTNNLDNLFQVPLVFVSACILALSLEYTSEPLLYNAWGFVSSRYLHTMVHVTINRVLVRSVVFGVELYFLTAMWVELFSII